MCEAALPGQTCGGAIAAAVTDIAPERVAALGLLAPAGFGRIRLAELVSLPGLRNAVQAGLPLALRSRAALTSTLAVRGGAPARAAGATRRGGRVAEQVRRRKTR